VHLLEPDGEDRVPAAFAGALRAETVVRLVYRDRDGAQTRREVEPLGTIGKGGDWYLVAWCRLRDGVRAFRGDRMISVELTDERPPPRAFRPEDLDIPFGVLRSVVDPTG
jgi:predicted DNA-binding transcriptional regulator YafY